MMAGHMMKLDTGEAKKLSEGGSFSCPDSGRRGSASLVIVLILIVKLTRILISSIASRAPSNHTFSKGILPSVHSRVSQLVRASSRRSVISLQPDLGSHSVCSPQTLILGDAVMSAVEA